jgi:ABC-2 type transport system ATP-binding protein
MQTPHQTLAVQALRNTRCVEEIAHGRDVRLLSPHLPARPFPQPQPILPPRVIMARHQRRSAVESGDVAATTSARDEAQAPTLLRVNSITKQYADQVVLADVSFDVEAGEIIGIIGPNGAGKTTLLEAVAGILPMDRGDVRWRGKPLPVSRRHDAIFYLPDGVRPYQDQPVTRVLAFFADVYRRSTNEIADTVESVGLAPVLYKRVHSLSKGYGRRLMLALALLTPHPVLLMDEPFDGFDLRQTRDITDVLRREVGKGRTLILAIHQLMDAERVCDRFILLAEGRVRGVGTLNDLRARTGLTSGNLEDIFLALT